MEIQVISPNIAAGRLRLWKSFSRLLDVMMKMMVEKSFKRNAFDGSEFGETLTARKGKSTFVE